MIESPETSMPSRLTSARASNRSTVSTNFAEARACRPFSLTISSENCIRCPGRRGQRGIGAPFGPYPSMQLMYLRPAVKAEATASFSGLCRALASLTSSGRLAP